jgi:hypothetical protein
MTCLGWNEIVFIGCQLTHILLKEYLLQNPQTSYLLRITKQLCIIYIYF